MSTCATVGARFALLVPLTLFTLLSFAAPNHAQTRTSSFGDGEDGTGDSWRDQCTTARATDEYVVSPSEEGFRAANRAHNFHAYFGEEGIALVPQTSDSPTGAFTWRTSAWGREGELCAPGPATMQHAGTRVEYVYQDGLVEWYENGPRGLEQGFLIPRRPPGSGRLVLEGRIPENLHPAVSESGRDILLSDAEPSNVAILRYAELQVLDAAGKEVPSLLTATQGAIEILIDDRTASYPLMVDPLMTTPAWTGGIDQFITWLGSSVASAGDVNGDTYDDVIAGSILDQQVLLWYGSASGLGPDGTLGNADWLAMSSEGDSNFGYPVASAGDVNGDGYGDVIIGAGATGNSEGSAFVWYGSASGLGPSGTPENAHWSATGGADFTGFGRYVSSAGDVNGDGYDDVIIGASAYDNGQPNEGGAFVWYGSASGLGPNGTPQNADWSAETNQTSAGSNCRVGAAGDVNGDGYGDVLVGFPYYDNVPGDTGIVLVWYGSASGLGPNGTPANADWRADSNQSTQLGSSVSTAGDVNGDGYDEVIAGAPGYDHEQMNEGGAFLWYGGVSGLGPNGTLTNADWTAEGDTTNSGFGTFLANAGDVEGAGFGSVIIGGHCYPRPEACAARAFAWFGSATGLGPTGSPNNADWNSTYLNDGSLLSVATAGRVNDDPFDDVIVGCMHCGQSSQGLAFVYLGVGNPAALELPPASAAAGLRLDAVRPNPFSQRTQIDYSVPKAGLVRLRIYDAAGRRVRTLVDQWTERQPQVARWDGRDAKGIQVPAGTYFIRLEAIGEVRTAKLTLTR